MSSNQLPTLYQQMIHLSRYSRWLPNESRRETWSETVSRYFDFFKEHLEEQCSFKLTDKMRNGLEEGILNLSVMPSMRCLMTAGEALKRENVAGYNCSFLPIDSIRSFDELLYILMCGTGVGFSVERQYINKLPEVPEELYPTDTTIIVADSKMGWARALKELISLLYAGHIPNWDLSRVRAAGMPLKTFGGRASGPGPLEDLFKFIISIFQNAAGRKLHSVECHDICCKIAEIVVVGGVRRSALISLSNLSDDRMRHAKSGQWWDTEGQRRLANNSAAYTEKPDIGIFMEEWLSLYNSKSGERGIFNRTAAERKIVKHGRREIGFEWGTNPCGEIILRPREFCNLSEVIARRTDTLSDLQEKVVMATILGTFQSTLTNFRYLTRHWKANVEEERLLGVSITGIMDNPILNGSLGKEKLKEALVSLQKLTIKTNIEWAKKLGINPSVAIATVKPSGTVSQLVYSGSGIHTQHNEHYIRRIRADKRDPITKFMIESKFPYEDDITDPNNTTIFSFPLQAPEGSITRKNRTAIEQLELWLIYRDYWTEHNPSITVSVKEHEWLEIGTWVYKHFNDVGGISFLPYTEHTYRQAPYEDITEKTYKQMLLEMPTDVDWSGLSEYESTDNTVGTQEFACSASGDSCDIVDIGM
tara:strand:- start:12 stop:1952 length:1941 start_codon:yes stop_codon:yes gene_type:complete